MKAEKTSAAPKRQWPLAAGLLALILGVLFFKSFLPDYVHFSNDGPLGQQMAEWLQLPGALTGGWIDLNYIGFNGGAAAPDVSAILHMLGPVGYSKFLAPIALFILGFGAWTFFNQLRLSRVAALLGAIAVGLNSAFFSTACWGVASQQIAAGFVFMGLALVVSVTPTMPPLIRWARISLAGLAIGINVMEAADIGAIYSMFAAAFVCYHAWFATEGSAISRISRGVGRVLVIAVSAVFIAAFAVSNLIGIGIKGVAGAQQDTQTKQEKWDWATQWSLPKRETITLIVPGFFGYRMDTPEGGNYWGAIGRDPAWYRYFESGKQGTPPQGFLRFSGGGCYQGITAVLLAFWAAFQALRKKSVFTLTEQRLVWFWAAALVISLALAYGRFAPFYQFFYALPYFSTIRNPVKFLHIFTFSLTVLAAYGVHGLCRGFLESPLQNISGLGARLKAWWKKASSFDKRWTAGCLIAIGASVVGWMIYASSQPALEKYLGEVQLGGDIAPQIAAFSIRQVGWYILFLALGVGMITLIMSGAFAGRRAKAGGIFLGLLLVVDLGRANLPWIKFVDYKEKNATNPIIQMLRDKPYEHRVAILPFRAPPQFALLDQLYRIEWAQHQFPYYNVQSLDIIQMPRMPEDLAAFEQAVAADGTPNTVFRVCRRWELTNTRYLLGAAPYLDVLNQQLDPVKRRFRVAASFDIVPRPGIANPTRLEELTAVVNSSGNGQYAVFEFTGALPRAKLYSQWQVSTNDQATLKIMGSEAFDPAQTVLVAGGVPAHTNAAATNSGTAEFLSYSSKNIKLKTKSTAASILLLNDKYDPMWQVWVDGKQAELLRCNFIMRGVQVPAGEHTVEFRFRADMKTLYISVAGIGLAFVLIGVIAVHAKSKGP